MDSRQAGIAGIFILLLIFLFLIGGLIGLDYGYVAFINRCGDASIGECLVASPTPTPKLENTVTATGNFSAKDYGVNIIMNVPLGGGPVSGSFSGDCQGKIRGNYDGNDNGTISGNARGSCNPFVVPVPASASFSGNVNKVTKTILINGTGSAAGFSGSGSITLNF